MAFAEGRIGPNIGGDGTVHELRLDRTGALGTTNAHGRYLEANARGALFTISTALAGVTLAAANASPLAANTGAPVLGVYNPVGSGKNIVINHIYIQHISGTPAAGAWSWDVYAAPTNTSQAGTQPYNLLSGKQTGSVAVGLVNQATTGTALAATKVTALPLGAFAGALAATSVGMHQIYIPDGLLIVPPGAIGGLAVPGAGTTHVVAGALMWEETPV